MSRKLSFVLFAISMLLTIGIAITVVVLLNKWPEPVKSFEQALTLVRRAKSPERIKIAIPRVLSGHDEDGDGIDDLDDILLGARAEAKRHPYYKSAYYKGGYPPPDEGVCTDVIWRAIKEAGYDLKTMIDRDIESNVKAYPRVGGKPDPNIDFRRAPNLVSFFSRHSMELPIEITPGDVKSLEAWQGGDIVVFDKPYPHIGIVSDKRRDDGVPLLIHNGGPYATESDYLTSWLSPISHHFRFPKSPNR